MEILGYGEDALTLWALKNKPPEILEKLDDKSPSSDCKVFFRPSFGRSGGPKSAQFGEFDFILLSKERLYLGESKWYRSSENIHNGFIKIPEVQLLRHRIFKVYVEVWSSGKYTCTSWPEFTKAATIQLREKCIYKPIAPDESLLKKNLITVLEVVKEHLGTHPLIENVLLYLYCVPNTHLLPQSAGSDFEVVSIDCSEGAFKNYVFL